MSSRLTVPVGGGNGQALREIAALFLRLGCTAFGGPAAHVSVLETNVVTQRPWLSRAEFLDLLGVVQVLPGPNSTELAIHIGQLRGGWRGGVLAGLCFVLPSVAMVWLLASVASAPAIRPIVTAVLWWLAPVVVAVLVEAQWKFGSQAWQRPGAPLVMLVTVLAAVALPSDLAVLTIGAATAIARHGGRPRRASTIVLLLASVTGVSLATAQATVPIAMAPGTAAILQYFLRAGASVFGSGYVLLAYLQRDLVIDRHWLSQTALTQASALAQVTPGPLFATATAAGYFVGGNAGALAATVGIFAPAFLSVTVSGPLRRLIQRSPWVRAALDGIVVASVTLLGRAIVGFALPLGQWQWVVCAVAIAATCFARVQGTLLLLAAVSAGIVAEFFHFTLS